MTTATVITLKDLKGRNGENLPNGSVIDASVSGEAGGYYLTFGFFDIPMDDVCLVSGDVYDGFFKHKCKGLSRILRGE